MVRLHRYLLPLALVMLALAPVAYGDADEKEPVVPRVASAEEATQALAAFKDAYKARGLKGEEKLLQRDYALSELARVQHPEVAKALTKIAKSGNHTLRTLAVIYLGEQKAIPGLAGPPILNCMKRNSKDPMLLISGLQSLGSVRYFGASKEIGTLLGHRDFAVKKAAIQAVGQIGEMRLWKEICKLAGVTVRTGNDVDSNGEQGSKEEVVEEGYSYEGVEVFYDTGTAGDGDQKMAEKIGKAKLAANKAAAMAKAGRSGSGGGGGGSASSGSAGRGGVSRNPKELMPFVLNTLWMLTGEKFNNTKELAKWVVKNRETIKERVELLDMLQKHQMEEAKEIKNQK